MKCNISQYRFNQLVCYYYYLLKRLNFRKTQLKYNIYREKVNEIQLRRNARLFNKDLKELYSIVLLISLNTRFIKDTVKLNSFFYDIQKKISAKEILDNSIIYYEKVACLNYIINKRYRMFYFKDYDYTRSFLFNRENSEKIN